MHFISMAYVEGRPLAEVIASDTCPPLEQVVRWVIGIARALGVTHAAGILHRDVKPSNVIIDVDGNPVVMDFGLARRVGTGDATLTERGMPLGTPAYMSPEQARGEVDELAPTTDVFSLGVVLYELLAGHRPFRGSITDVLGQILHVEPEPPSTSNPDVDDMLDELVNEMVAKSSADRIGAMKEGVTRLEKWQQLHGGRSTAGEFVVDIVMIGDSFDEALRSALDAVRSVQSTIRVEVVDDDLASALGMRTPSRIHTDEFFSLVSELRDELGVAARPTIVVTDVGLMEPTTTSSVRTGRARTSQS